MVLWSPFIKGYLKAPPLQISRFSVYYLVSHYRARPLQDIFNFSPTWVMGPDDDDCWGFGQQASSAWWLSGLINKLIAVLQKSDFSAGVDVSGGGVNTTEHAWSSASHMSAEYARRYRAVPGVTFPAQFGYTEVMTLIRADNWHKLLIYTDCWIYTRS